MSRKSPENEPDVVPSRSPSEPTTPAEMEGLNNIAETMHAAAQARWNDHEAHLRYLRLLGASVRYEGDLYNARGRRIRPRESWVEWHAREINEMVYRARRWVADKISP